MHELGIVVHMLNRVEELANQNSVDSVTRIVLEIGEVSGIVNSLFIDAFEWSKKKIKCLENARLDIVPLKAISYCKNCKKTFSTTENGKECPHCKSKDTYLVTGDEINIQKIEVKNG